MAPQEHHPLASPDTECWVLAGCMAYPYLWHRVAPLLREDHFFQHAHRLLWRCLCRRASAGQPTDALAMAEDLRATGQLEDAGGMEYLAGLAETALPNIDHHARHLAELGRRRAIVGFCHQLQVDAPYTPADELVDRLIARMSDLTSGADRQAHSLAQCAVSGTQAVEEARQRSREGVLGVSTTLPSLDHVLGGIHGPNLFVLAGRPGLGKTALVTQVLYHAARQGHPGLFLSIEMSEAQLAQRAAASLTRISLSLISRGKPEAITAMGALTALGDLPAWIDDTTCDLDAICARIALYQRRNGIEWAAIDHIGLIRTERFNSRNEQMGHVSWTLKRLAKRLGIPIIALSQLSRRSEQDGRRPRADDLRDSGNIEQDADVIVMLHTGQEDRAQPRRPVQIGIVKNRLGPSLWFEERFEFDGATQRFYELASVNAMPEPPRSAPRDSWQDR